MAIMQEAQAHAQFEGLGEAFGYNEGYCDEKYPWASQTDAAARARMMDFNAKCKKGCSGFSCITNPGMAASPWTVLGRNARGLPDDSLLGTLLSTATGAIKPPGTKPPGQAGQAGQPGQPGQPSASSGNIFGNTTTLVLLGAVGLIGASIYMKRGRRGFAGFGGYSKQNRRVRRIARKSKRSR
jgi:hypothetical protein